MKKKIFISYSHLDEAWKDRLVKHLNILALKGLCDVWDDRKISIGADWKPEIENALNEAHIAVLMISPDFLTSNFICSEEIPKILELREKQGLWVIPVFVKPCPWKKIKWLAAIQGVPRDNITLRELEDQNQMGKVEKILADLSEDISERIQTDLQTVLSVSNSFSRSEEVQPVQTPGPNPALEHCKNPFSEVCAIRDEQKFINRESDLQRLRLLLSGGSVSLQGNSKIGKSSMLWKLAAVWSEPVIGPLSIQVNSWEEIVSEITAQAGKIYKSRKDFRDAMLSFRGLLLLDEMELGTRKGLTHKDCNIIRGCLEENRELKIVIASRTPLVKDSHLVGVDSPLFNICHPHILGLFTETAARELLAHPWAPGAARFRTEMEKKLLCASLYDNRAAPGREKEKPGYHPYLLQRAAFHSFEAMFGSGCDWHDAFQQDKEKML